MNLVLIVVIALLMYCSITDMLYRIIPNRIVFVILMLLLFYIYITGRDCNIILVFIVFLIGLLLYSFNIMGAGDIKLITVLTFIIPDSGDFIFFLLLTSLIGGGMAVTGCLLPVLKYKEKGVPYGVAITTGFTIYIYLLSRV